MDVNSCLLPISNLMLKCEGFEKHEDRLPATPLDPQLSNASALDVALRKSGSFSDKSSLEDGEYPQNMLDNDNILSFVDGDYLHNKLDDDDILSFEDGPLDYFTIEDVLGIVERVGPVESLKRLLLRTLLDIPRKPDYCVNFDPLPESTRDRRHVGDRCWHQYHHMSDLSENIINPVEVYGVVAVRDGEDYCRNYIFNRSRDNPLAINPFGAEATIQLDFLRVPPGGFDIQMCGYTSVQKNEYTFISKYCECDSFVSSVGRFPQYFVAAVQMEDILHIDFVEGGQPVTFKPAIHGSQVKEYHFHNGAIVSVTVCWSTTFYY
ncbi:hypothetical protein BAE44_0000357 [Dichanthelium oligosanthes]|uniref:DUF6598 domain-containing protein n=1 Tax=Dichanthelium oligosanthes TaxID=888268 RepID=A0A1E5WMM1_9POAL|nr:hypothetical protein BAE44_0000357 [Dichanthelium oligosanthes]